MPWRRPTASRMPSVGSITSVPIPSPGITATLTCSSIVTAFRSVAAPRAGAPSGPVVRRR
ncbi:hypothetical protein [Ornithinimicrobium kibberense]|uniref:hypothetical protein n=1 Tax=Ornithinimicrobium kibberense TaxID=282060 RepID=UPI003623F85B